MNFQLTINGLDNAFPREFGCDCARCMRIGRAANTSVSLLGISDDGASTDFHALIDCGHGVSDSLALNPLLRGARARLDWILFTHWHSDHSAELNRILAGWLRTCARREQAYQPVPVWCREGSARWLEIERGSAWKLIQPHMGMGIDDAGTVLTPVPIALTNLRITPITLHHSSADIAPGNPALRQSNCAGFVIQTQHRKAVLFWDMDNTNTWISAPHSEAHAAAFALARDPDFLFVDCNTWRFAGTPEKSASHASFHTLQPFIRALAPRDTLLMHLSGHEDAQGDGFGWQDAEWQSRAQAFWRQGAMPGAVRVPNIGEHIAL